MDHYLKFRFKHMIIFIVLLVNSFSYSSDWSVYCSGELEYEYMYSAFEYLNENIKYLREFVLPQGGLYEKHFFFHSNTCNYLHQSEKDALKVIVQKIDKVHGPPFIYPLFIQLSNASNPSAVRHIEAICIVKQLFEELPYIDCRHKCNFKITIEDLTKFKHLDHLELYSYSVSNEHMKISEIRLLPQLEYLGMPHDTSDEHLKCLVGLKKLEFLNCSRTKIKTNIGLNNLAKLPKIKSLDLRFTQFNRGALAGLSACQSLETLLLSHSSVTDDDLIDLIKLKNLKTVTLHHTLITEKGLKILKHLKSLQYMSLYNTPDYESGNQDITRWLPNVHVNTTPPKPLIEFLEERKYVRAFIGDEWNQFLLAASYEDNEKTIKDLIESLKWYKIISKQKDKIHNIRSGYKTNYEIVNTSIRELKKKLNEDQIAEAQRRADVYLFLYDRCNFDFTISRDYGLPIYQYAFESIIN